MSAEGEGRPGAQLVVISGPSGVGKDTIIEAMKRRGPSDGRSYIVTCTTRERRDGETDGESYRYLTLEAFERLRATGGLLEAADVYGKWYGTPCRPVVEALAGGRDAILKIDVQGARAVRDRVPESLLIFVVPPSLEELERRLRQRRTETPDQLDRRLRESAAELARQGEFDHVVINETDESDRTAEEIEAIVAEERARFPERRIRLSCGVVG